MTSSGSMDRAWKVLSGKEAPRFSLEHRLRFFQAMYFITGGDRTDRKLFIDAAITFASEFIRLEAAKKVRLRPSENIMRFICDKENRRMFDACFRSIDILNENNPKSFDAEVNYRGSYSMEINHYAYLTDIRMSVFKRTGKDQKTIANKILAEQSRERSERERMHIKGNYTRRKARILESKAAYICAAKTCDLESLYSLSQKGIRFERLFDMEIPKPEQFSDFCNKCRVISDSLHLKMSLSMRRVTNNSNMQYQPFTQVSEADIDGLAEKSSAGRVTHIRPAGE